MKARRCFPRQSLRGQRKARSQPCTQLVACNSGKFTVAVRTAQIILQMLCVPVITREMCEFGLSLNLSSSDNLPFKFLSHASKRPDPSVVHCADPHRSQGPDLLPLQTEQTHKQQLREILSAVPLQQPFAVPSCETPSPRPSPLFHYWQGASAAGRRRR